jgi:hypothetical protein
MMNYLEENKNEKQKKMPPPSPEESGKGKLCAPVSNGVDQEEHYLIVFEDNDRENIIMTDRQLAREAFARFELSGWNCHLFEQMKRVEDILVI